MLNIGPCSGVWHRARVKAAAQMLFVTAGDGTQHRPL
jgi:hypothetical protein